MLAVTSNPVDLVFVGGSVLLGVGCLLFGGRAPRRFPDPWREAALTERARMSGAARRARRHKRWAWLRRTML